VKDYRAAGRRPRSEFPETIIARPLRPFPRGRQKRVFRSSLATPLRARLLTADFVEVVLTYFHDSGVPTKKVRVHRHDRMFLRIDYNIVDPVFAEQARGRSGEPE